MRDGGGGGSGDSGGRSASQCVVGADTACLVGSGIVLLHNVSVPWWRRRRRLRRR
jgi:hypothetical protein